MTSSPFFSYKSFTTTRNLIYSYIHIVSKDSSQRYILFLHGFPSLARDFHHQIKHFANLGYGIIVPNQLGYGPQTSKPQDADAYRLKFVAEDLVAILDHEGIDQPVLSVGHDWGVPILSRLEYYFPQRIARMAFLTIGYNTIGQPFDLDFVNKMTADNLGFAAFGYQDFFVRQNAQAVKLLNEQRSSFDSLMFTDDAMALWPKHFGAIGGLEAWLQTDSRSAIAAGVTDEDVQTHYESFDQSHAPLQEGEFGGGYAGPLNWYKALVNNLNMIDEKSAADAEPYVTSKPILMILATRDPIAVPEMHVGMTQPYAGGGLDVKKVDSGHFVMLEKSKEVNEYLQSFFEKE